MATIARRIGAGAAGAAAEKLQVRRDDLQAAIEEIGGR